MFLRPSRRLRLVLLVALPVCAAALPAAAQSTPSQSPPGQSVPGPTELPWNARRGAVRVFVARLGLRESGGPTVIQGDTAITFTAEIPGGGTAQLTTRFRQGRLWHALYVARGDSASLQRHIDRSVATLTGRYGRAAEGDAHSRVWVLRDGRRFTLPLAPARADGGGYTFGVVYNGT